MRRFLVARRANPDPHTQDTRWTVPSGTLENSNKKSVNAQAQDFIKSLLASNGVPALSQHRYGLSEITYVQNERDMQGVQPPPSADRVAIHGSCSLLRESQYVAFTSELIMFAL